jgi:hypothetical protein
MARPSDAELHYLRDRQGPGSAAAPQPPSGRLPTSIEFIAPRRRELHEPAARALTNPLHHDPAQS